jgi:hypothetical protein
MCCQEMCYNPSWLGTLKMEQLVVRIWWVVITRGVIIQEVETDSYLDVTKLG